MIKRIIPFLLVLFLAGCATLNIKEQENNIFEIFDYFNKQQRFNLMESSSIPFLYDGEILLVKEDIVLLWNNLLASGFTIKEPVVKSIEYADKDDYGLFASSMEVKTFFKKYVPVKAILTTVISKNGTFYFITGKKVRGLTQIIAMKGPVK